MLVLSSLLLVAYSVASNVSVCNCGYRDNDSGFLYTESIISYFNESGIDGNQFIAQAYTHQSERSWNALYRQSASPQNVLPGNVTNTAALQLLINPPTQNHVVVGSSIQTSRRDLLYGTFRAFIRSPPPSHSGGSVLTMSVQYDDTDSININLMNTNDPSTARLSMLMHGEFPTRATTIQYSDILAAAATDASVQSPWNFNEVRIDWHENEVAYHVGGNLTRMVRKSRDKSSSPSSFYLRHWSTGDKYTSQGPPPKRTIAEIGWGRLFFNSSLMSLKQHQAYDDACRAVDPCSVDDWTLRGYSPFDPVALLPWRKPRPKVPKRVPAIVVSILSVAITVFLLTHAVIRRQPWKKRIPVSESSDQLNAHAPSTLFANGEDPVMPSRPDGPFRNSTTGFPVTPASGSTYGMTLASPYFSASALSLGGARFSRTQTLNERVRAEDVDSVDAISLVAHLPNKDAPKEQTTLPKSDSSLEQMPIECTTIATHDIPGEVIVYLDGLLLVCCVVIAIVDFALTFNPALIEPFGMVHYVSETWARRTITPIFLSFIWVGPIITISSRYLAAAYLRQGNLEDVARKAVGQVPRLMIPVLVVTLIEYFSINAGITNSLTYLPSLSWSEWPYTSTYSNFANWITELIELAYLVPNAAPAITFHYCTGVLWLIPVLIQFSWAILLGAVVIREIRSPRKRLLYYAFAFVANWYARSWGAFLWFGLLLADLDVTYDYKTRLSSRAWLSAAVSVSFLILALLGGAADLVTEWTTYNFSIAENNIHPDISTALPLSKTSSAGYPPYYVPRLSALVFAAGLHGFVETCHPVQSMLSTKIIARLSPHALTIYMIHGLVYWSWGAWLAVKLAGDVGMPYWAVSMIVAITSFTFIAMSLPVLTPVLGTLERHMRDLAWHTATREPPTKRTTIFPFDQDLIRSYDKYDIDKKA